MAPRAIAEDPLEMTDSCALLWQPSLRGIEIEDRWESACKKWQTMLPKYGFYSFNDCHTMLAFVGAGRIVLARKAVDGISKTTNSDNDSATIMRTAGLPIAKALPNAISAFAIGSGDYETSMRLLSAVRLRTHRLGGSHAQRT